MHFKIVDSGTLSLAPAAVWPGTVTASVPPDAESSEGGPGRGRDSGSDLSLPGRPGEPRPQLAPLEPEAPGPMVRGEAAVCNAMPAAREEQQASPPGAVARLELVPEHGAPGGEEGVKKTEQAVMEEVTSV